MLFFAALLNLFDPELLANIPSKIVVNLIVARNGGLFPCYRVSELGVLCALAVKFAAVSLQVLYKLPTLQSLKE